ncbi:MAG: alpha/beta hydrolase [Gordonia sp. (in: high G+C Gram-positive bacteria)]
MPIDDDGVPPRPTALIAMPGTGSDADYVRRAFGPAARMLGVELIATQPGTDLPHTDFIHGYRRILDRAAADHHSVLVGGVSIGAAVALDWALGPIGIAHCAGVLAALPAWSGDPANAVAAYSARVTAATLTQTGLESTIDTMVASSPTWLSAELSRSWRALYPALIGQLQAAAAYIAPDATRIASLRAPLAITAAVDDPLHPLAVAQEWHSAAARADLTEIRLCELGDDARVLGDSCARGWLRLTGCSSD